MNPPCSRHMLGSSDDDLSNSYLPIYLKEVLDACGADAVDVHGIPRTEVADRREDAQKGETGSSNRSTAQHCQ